ncbi:hypothetical protein CDAR_492301 [Caerostris darwini]|uniref:Uncharacterized protein n=1 Tax=Caerostris darwini TaxID=1538125 RepID=A0AAV4V098_9ARAC|nr:hypothetical protein CDAR_492301 [Caerostris darwini]
MLLIPRGKPRRRKELVPSPLLPRHPATFYQVFCAISGDDPTNPREVQTMMMTFRMLRSFSFPSVAWNVVHDAVGSRKKNIVCPLSLLIPTANHLLGLAHFDWMRDFWWTEWATLLFSNLP